MTLALPLAVGLTFALAGEGSSAATRRALLVGIDTYGPPPQAGGRAIAWRDLQGAVRDVEAVRSVLIARHDFRPENIKVLSNEAATRDGILNTIRKHLVAGSQPGDVALFFYAGHGSRVRNSRSSEPDGMDETIVPSDAHRGARDIRDKELARALNDVIDTGAHLTAIFDSCHSGSIGRGLPSAMRARSVPPDERDIAKELGPEPEDPRGEPEQRGALVLSAAQDTQSAGETRDASGAWHGLFSSALVEALRNAPVNETVELLFRRVRALMGSDAQLPVLAGRGRERKPLFGVECRGTAGRIVVAVERVDEDGRIVLLGGAALALGAGSELERTGAQPGAASVRVRIEQVDGLARSRASVVRGDSARIRPGDLFELVRWVAPDEPFLRVFIPPPLAIQELQGATRRFAALCDSEGIRCVTDPIETTPTDLVSWDGAEWRLSRHGTPDDRLGREPSAERARQAIGSSPGREVRLFVFLPPPTGTRENLGFDAAAPGAVQVALATDEADYFLVGRWNSGRIEYAWVRPNVTRADAVVSPLPPGSDWLPMRGPPDSPEMDASLVRERALRLARVAGWLRVKPPPDDGTFPYRLTLKNTKTGTTTIDGTVRDGDTYALALEARPGDLKPPLVRRFVYVFSVDAHGARTLLFPRSGQGNVENRLPWARPAGSSDGERFPAEIVLTRGAAFRVGPPFGVDTFVLLTSREPIDPGVLEEEGARTRGAPATDTPETPLARLFASVGSAATRGVQLALPVDWSIERLSLRSVPAEGR
jgi:hypothetical protein